MVGIGLFCSSFVFVSADCSFGGAMLAWQYVQTAGRYALVRNSIEAPQLGQLMIRVDTATGFINFYRERQSMP